jgi:hypothetical protein
MSVVQTIALLRSQSEALSRNRCLAAGCDQGDFSIQSCHAILLFSS